MSVPFANRYGPWALVAGASEGLGEAFARAAARRGLNTLLVARRAEKLAALADALRAEFSVDVDTLSCDLADPGAAQTIETYCADREVGLLVYNAAYSLIGPFEEQTLDNHLQEIRVNCAGPLSLVYRLAPKMLERGRGGIVLLSSMAGFQGSALVANYGATKAYNLVLAEGLWDEFRSRGVDVMACCAGATRTPNYLNSRPKTNFAARSLELAPDAVAEETLTKLGSRPSLIPGRGNRLAAALMQRLLPRKRAVRIMGDNTRGMYGDS